eukprot:TRINITY_DN8553_c0_g1_i1.p1 TRINITY_DN8553_c0_g1~~TRINITY_DN8553_c0_g1_i1.p1  ORF type:complete len:277 (-),score=3.94 TRINITY_DN8553_c0_g1_i1:196-1026(-)
MGCSSSGLKTNHNFSQDVRTTLLSSNDPKEVSIRVDVNQIQKEYSYILSCLPDIISNFKQIFPEKKDYGYKYTRILRLLGEIEIKGHSFEIEPVKELTPVEHLFSCTRCAELIEPVLKMLFQVVANDINGNWRRTDQFSNMQYLLIYSNYNMLRSFKLFKEAKYIELYRVILLYLYNREEKLRYKDSNLSKILSALSSKENILDLELDFCVFKRYVTHYTETQTEYNVPVWSSWEQKACKISFKALLDLRLLSCSNDLIHQVVVKTYNKNLDNLNV